MKFKDSHWNFIIITIKIFKVPNYNFILHCCCCCCCWPTLPQTCRSTKPGIVVWAWTECVSRMVHTYIGDYEEFRLNWALIFSNSLELDGHWHPHYVEYETIDKESFHKKGFHGIQSGRKLQLCIPSIGLGWVGHLMSCWPQNKGLLPAAIDWRSFDRGFSWRAINSHYVQRKPAQSILGA